VIEISKNKQKILVGSKRMEWVEINSEDLACCEARSGKEPKVCPFPNGAEHSIRIATKYDETSTGGKHNQIALLIFEELAAHSLLPQYLCISLFHDFESGHVFDVRCIFCSKKTLF
jgi:hypothetical protein